MEILNDIRHINNIADWTDSNIIKPIGNWMNENTPIITKNKDILNEKTKDTEETGNTQENNIPSLEEIWEREDTIRKETQKREDTAYQRAIEDMRKAGINPNLVGVNPANSGGGIISETGQNLISTEMSGKVNQAIAEINNTIKADENQKDRISDIIKTLAMYFILKK